MTTPLLKTNIELAILACAWAALAPAVFTTRNCKMAFNVLDPASFSSSSCFTATTGIKHSRKYAQFQVLQSWVLQSAKLPALPIHEPVEPLSFRFCQPQHFIASLLSLLESTHGFPTPIMSLSDEPSDLAH